MSIKKKKIQDIKVYAIKTEIVKCVAPNFKRLVVISGLALHFCISHTCVFSCILSFPFFN